MSGHTAFLIAFLLMLTLPSLFTLCRLANAQENWVQISCSTDNRLSLDYLGLDFIVYENNSILLLGSTQFEAIGSQPILDVSIDSYGRAPSSPSGIITSDVAFFIVDSSRDYYVGPYYERYNVNATIKNGIVEYQLNFSDNVKKAMDAISKQGTIEDYGVRGTMTFETTIRDSVGIIGQKRFFRILLRTHADLSTITCNVIVPQTADFKEAEKDGEAMRKIMPYWAQTNVLLQKGQQSGADLYSRWDMPEELPLPMRYPYNLIISIIISYIVGLLSKYSYDKIRSLKRALTQLLGEKARVRLLFCLHVL